VLIVKMLIRIEGQEIKDPIYFTSIFTLGAFSEAGVYCVPTICIFVSALHVQIAIACRLHETRGIFGESFQNPKN
jgi:hypothetical protein